MIQPMDRDCENLDENVHFAHEIPCSREIHGKSA